MKNLIIIFLSMNLLLADIIFNSASYAQTTYANVKTAKQNSLQNILLNQNYILVTLKLASKHNSIICIGSLDKINYQPLLIDTGATTTNIDPLSVQKAGLKPSNKSIIAGGGEDITHRAYELTIPTLYLGNFIAHNELSVVLDQSPKKIDKHHLMATLGMTFFREHQSIIDIRENHLYLKKDAKKADLRNYHERLLQMGYTTIPLIVTPSGHVIIKAKVNNSSSVNMLFDSGVPFTTLSTDFAKKLKLKMQPWTVGGGAGGGKITFLKTHIKNLVTGPINWSPYSVGVMDVKNVKVKTTIAGIIGLDWMQAHQVIIDSSNNLLFVKST